MEIDYNDVINDFEVIKARTKPLLHHLLCHLISTASDSGPRNSSWQGARCTPVVHRSREHHTGVPVLGSPVQVLSSTPILKENIHQPHEGTCSSKAI
ncbi:hypothetical protein TNCV_1241881 [Trichonephila clavipes]|nr:hypothetical protein TNCV_1241881 [Trichonephila clavipes]